MKHQLNLKIQEKKYKMNKQNKKKTKQHKLMISQTTLWYKK